MTFGCSIGIFLNSANLICRSTDISKCFRGSLRLRDNESRLYIIQVKHGNQRRNCCLRSVCFRCSKVIQHTILAHQKVVKLTQKHVLNLPNASPVNTVNHPRHMYNLYSVIGKINICQLALTLKLRSKSP